MKRRSFLARLVWGFFFLLGMIFLFPVILYLKPKRSREEQNLFTDVDLVPIKGDILKEGESKVGLGIRGEPTIVLHYGGTLQAFSAVCTHLGCVVKWVREQDIFFCPCHAGKFDANGVNIGGPPPTPLKRFRAYLTKEGFIALSEV